MKWIIFFIGLGVFCFWDDLSTSTAHDNFNGRWKSTMKQNATEVLYVNLKRTDENNYSIELSKAIDVSSKKSFTGRLVLDNEIEILANRSRLVYSAKKDVIYWGLLELEHLDRKKESTIDVFFKLFGAIR
jgi:hypothetical protein